MQPFLLLWLISSAMGSSPGGPGTGQPYFDALHQPPPRRWPCLLLSLLVHLAVLLALPSLLDAIAPPDQPALWARQVQFDRALRIRVPERLYLASGGRRDATARRRSGAGQAARAAAPKAGSPAAQDRPPTRAAGPRRRFELPPLARRAAHPQSILQPELPPELPLSASVRLPELFFWSPKPPVPFRPRVFVVPGYARPPEEPARLDAPPRLELPPELPGLPFLTAPASPGLAEETALAAAARLPLRALTAQPPAPTPRAATADTSWGDPLTVLSLSSQPRPLREMLVIPPANQLGALPQGSGGPGAPQPAAAQGAQAAAAAAPDAEPAQAAGEAVIALNRPDVPGTLPVPAGHPAPVAPEAPAAPPEPSPAPRASRLAEATRLEHPTGGVFDVVVQSAGADGFPESAGVLSGKPIYSVYINVGGPKEWILQYCIPGGDAGDAEFAGGVLRLGSPSPLVAPYPRVTFRPPVKRRPGAPYVMVHGFLDANGRPEALKVLGLHGPEDGSAMLPVLNEWEFRPATQDGRALRVEILLAIPAE